MDLITKDTPLHMLAFAKGVVSEENRTVRFVISSDKIDRHNERVEVEAVAAAIKDFAKNPTALACHLHRLDNGRSPVVGSWDTDSFKAKAHQSEMDLNFADTELGLGYWGLYRDKHMRAVSIGFYPMEWREEKTGKDGRIFVIDKLELIEISCVAVGANRQALSKVKGFEQYSLTAESTSSELSADAIKAIVTETVKSQLDEFALRIEDGLDEIKSLLIPDSSDFAKGLLGGPPNQPDAGTKDKPRKTRRKRSRRKPTDKQEPSQEKAKPEGERETNKAEPHEVMDPAARTKAPEQSESEIEPRKKKKTRRKRSRKKTAKRADSSK